MIQIDSPSTRYYRVDLLKNDGSLVYLMFCSSRLQVEAIAKTAVMVRDDIAGVRFRYGLVGDWVSIDRDVIKQNNWKLTIK